jgi:hypothetical protein
MYVHTRSVADKVFEVWRSPGRFTKNPDIVRLPSGRLLLVYSDTDAHWSLESQIMMLLASDDGGRTWSKHREVVRHDLDKGDGRLLTPRLSLLDDGRVVVLVDQDDFSHFHEEQPPGILAFWSDDGGDTWSEGQETGIKGFEPDRVMDLPDGRLAVASQLMRGETMEYAEIFSCSEDGGETWYEQATIAYDGYHRFCEGAIVVLDGGKELACVLRESHCTGIPSFVAFSSDMGRTWSEPQMMPFAIHRPYARQLPDGRVLVTGRHVNGGLGTYAWCGDLKAEAGEWQVGGPAKEHTAELTAEALVIDNRPGHECRYSLLPPESSLSEILLEGTLSVEGPSGESVAFLSVAGLIPDGTVVEIASNGVMLAEGKHNMRVPADMTGERTVAIHHRRGMLEVSVDGEILIRYRVKREGQTLDDRSGGNPAKRTQFGQLGETGRSFWRRVSYSVKNQTLDDVEWSWDVSDGVLPDEYQRTRMVQIHANDPDQKPSPDHGYTSWLHLADGRIMLVDYTNCGDEPGRSHLVGVHLDPADIL